MSLDSNPETELNQVAFGDKAAVWLVPSGVASLDTQDGTGLFSALSHFKSQSEARGLIGLLLAKIVPPLSNEPSQTAAWVAVCYNEETTTQDVDAVLERASSDRLYNFNLVSMPAERAARVCTFDGLPNQWKTSNVSGIFFAQTPSRRRIPIQFTSLRTVGELKDAIQDKEGILPVHYKIIFKGEQLGDARRLADYRIFPGDYVLLVPRLPSTHVFFVKPPTRKYITIQFTDLCTVEQLKDVIQDKEGIPPDQQRLMFKGVQLEDAGCLGDYMIGPDDTVHLLPRLRGGSDGMKFVSVENGSLTRGFNASAPSWRAVDSGLNLMGRCQNSQCAAHNRVIWVPKGIGIFKLHTLQQSQTGDKRILDKCPRCNSSAEMIGMGFMECVWTAWGGKISPTGSIDFFRKQDQIVRPEDKFQLFAPQKSGEETYSTLTIRADDLSDDAVCIRRIEDSTIKGFTVSSAISLCDDYQTGCDLSRLTKDPSA
ncbi:uncharacterized protein EI90DRAFT_3055483 [Cantharellus anzutake]|uniref:uncharacterized protein n=1 Tax=Cantharellus anzutake TaxID=1750568 RepID=UPI0019050432|nr:uncharacterized protein EI90DRAFT_3055483 [Cantharellus anzutake]KAF8332390.1 hypothetical protein EI90DRAFT_3055483 [Cantharellus anzutake]